MDSVNSSAVTHSNCQQTEDHAETKNTFLVTAEVEISKFDRLLLDLLELGCYQKSILGRARFTPGC